MRVFKPTYSKPLPEGAKTFLCKQGPDKGKALCKWKDRSGHTQTARLTKAGDKILCEVTNWHIEFDDHLGIRRKIKAHTSKDATDWEARQIQKLLDCRAGHSPLTPELQAWLEKLKPAIRDELIGFGLIEAQRASVGQPLTEHVAEYTDYLSKKERGQNYVKEVQGILSRVFGECGFVTWSDISGPRLKDYLDELRDGGKGISKRRYNALLGCVKSFCKWMVKQRKATSSPVEYLDGMDNQQTDSRHPRRVLELDELRRFLEAALRGPKKHDLSGYERNLLYRFAIETGLRAVDVRRLRVRDFDFKQRTISIGAGRIKNKADATVYLRPATAAELQQYCANKMPHAHVFHLTVRTAQMVKHDLRNAGIPYCKNGEYFDFHSLRHQCASLLAMNPDTPEAVRQQALRHKTPEMTRHYSHAFEVQQREAIESLPDLTQPSTESQASVKTRTDNVTTNFLSKSCSQDTSQCEIDLPVENRNLDSVAETHFCSNSEGMERRFDPLRL